MPITINNGELTSSKSGRKRVTAADLSPEKFEVYGRLRLSVKEIAELEGVSKAQMAQFIRHPKLREAYDMGRAQCVVAIRQKQVAMALAGDTRMLIFAGEKFANQGEEHEAGIPDHYDPGQHSWDGRLRDRLEQLRAKYGASDDTGSA